jgi:hypothetical protein
MYCGARGDVAVDAGVFCVLGDGTACIRLGWLTLLCGWIHVPFIGYKIPVISRSSMTP